MQSIPTMSAAERTKAAETERLDRQRRRELLAVLNAVLDEKTGDADAANAIRRILAPYRKPSDRWRLAEFLRMDNL